MRQTLKITIACFSILALSACGGSKSLPEPVRTMSFEELESQYAQKLGVTACVEFGGGNYENAARYFRILEAIVPAWEGYADGVLREGKSFDARNCY
jgi:hypothetical protein